MAIKYTPNGRRYHAVSKESDGFDFIVRHQEFLVGQQGPSFGEPGDPEGDQGHGFCPEDKAGVRKTILQKKKIDKNPQGGHRQDYSAGDVNEVALDFAGCGGVTGTGEQKKGEEGQYGEENAGCHEVYLSGQILRPHFGGGEPGDQNSAKTGHIARQVVQHIIPPVEKEEKPHCTHGSDKDISHP